MKILLQSLKNTMTAFAIVSLFAVSIQAISVAEAVDATLNVKLTVDSELSINGTTTGTTTLTDIQLLPNLGVSNDVASNTQNNISIETTNAAGYLLTLHATSSPAMQHDTTAATIANHNNGGTPGDWGAISSATEFGFSVFSSTGGGSDTDIVDGFEDPDGDSTTGAQCLGLPPNTDPSIASFDSVFGATNELGFAAAPVEASAITVATRATATAGPTDFDFCFYVESDSDNPDSGDYTATIVLRAITL